MPVECGRDEKQHNPDPNKTAARALRHALRQAGYTEMPATLEEVWTDWAKQVEKVDERSLTLLKAVFEAGAAARRWEA